MTTATELLERIARDLSDTDNGRWDRPALYSMLNASLREVVTLVPQANTVEESVQLSPGVAQSIPATALSLVAPLRNMGSSGSDPGAWIHSVDKRAKDQFTPGWASHATGTVVREVMVDPAMPRAFWTYPPIPSSPAVWISLRLAGEPTRVDADNEGDELDTGAAFDEAVVLGVIARALRMQTDVGSHQKAGDYRNEFLRTLGRTDLVVPPTRTRAARGDDGGR